MLYRGSLSSQHMEKQQLPKGRRTKAINEAISMLVECGMTEMTCGGFDYEESDFTREDIAQAYLIILKKVGIE